MCAITEPNTQLRENERKRKKKLSEQVSLMCSSVAHSFDCECTPPPSHAVDRTISQKKVGLKEEGTELQ